ncbi:hypothetical protein SLS53_008720 [Cytospora paraplurivora]|uniref:PD-(D/E)XK nuclease-like domain-containing protein n=1 Tax=Cytospora paraplurivora TaxID=2898453 RepID=A0AAN9YCH2_9PEZI
MTHTRSGSKKVDFALVLDPAPSTTLYTAVHAVLARLQQTYPQLSQSINSSGYSPLKSAPIAVLVETKTMTPNTDPLGQLGMIAAAFHRRLHTLPVQNATGTRPITDTGVIVTLPLISVTDHQWEVYFARDSGRTIQMVGPVELGSTRTLISTYMLLASLRLLESWIQEKFCPALEEWFSVDPLPA